MSASILNRYLAAAFAKWIMGIFVVCLSIIFLADFVEMLRQASDHPETGLPTVALVTLLRLPSFGEQLMPFAVLFGSIGAMLTLSRKLELVVTRSVGVSVWQFVWPGILVSFAIGLVAMLAYNPMAAAMKERADELRATSIQGRTASDEQLWLRQIGEDGQSVIHAQQAFNGGLRLAGVTMYLFDAEGGFHERVDAETAELADGQWVLRNTVVSAPNTESRMPETYVVDTTFTPDQIREASAASRSVSFWSLPSLIERANQAGLPATHFRLQYQSLLASPLLFLAMVLIAATVSLRLFRLGNVGWMILGGVVAGFVLYVIGRLAQDLGSNGLVHPVVAAWVPALVALLMGLTVLLHQEDG